jgi:hypothetical protein
MAGKPKEFEKLQLHPDGPLFNFYGPPSAVGSIPITLIHQIFGQFVDDSKNYTPTAADNALVLSLSRAMSEFFPDERDRVTKFREILRDYDIDLAASEIEGGRGSRTDGDLRFKGLCYAVLEGKNNIGGGGGAHPLLQALIYYLTSMKEYSERDANARLPSLIIYLCGGSISSQYWSWT